jgi:hypothetical protein
MNSTKPALTPKLRQQIQAYAKFRKQTETKLNKQEDKIALEFQKIFPKTCKTLEDATGWALELGNDYPSQVLKTLASLEAEA